LVIWLGDIRLFLNLSFKVGSGIACSIAEPDKFASLLSGNRGDWRIFGDCVGIFFPASMLSHLKRGPK
jgi:hypothetical protein